MSASDHLKSDIDELVPDMVALRRDLHAHPELAFEAVRTILTQDLGYVFGHSFVADKQAL